MTDSNNTNAVAASSRKRPRHFHQGPNELEEGEQRVEEAAAAQPPAARLYRHALESIFAFLNLKELSSVLAVSRSWSAAVGSMRSIDARVSPSGTPPPRLLASGLARHISELGARYSQVTPSAGDLQRMCERMSALRVLHCKLAPSVLLEGPPLVFPPSLTELHVNTSEATPLVAKSVFVAVARLPRLTEFAFRFPFGSPWHPLISFEPLLQAPRLHTLTLSGIKTGSLSQLQINELRAMPHLTSFDHCLTPDQLKGLLERPHQLQWKPLRVIGEMGDKNAELLAGLPSLTEITWLGLSNLSFLRFTPNLCVFRLDFLTGSLLKPLPTPEQLIADVPPLVHLTELTIQMSDLTASYLIALLSRMPSLSRLALRCMHGLESLHFLSSEPLQRSLTSLTLFECDHGGLTEGNMQHVISLRQLEKLAVIHSFKLGAFARFVLTPPSILMPKLKTFKYS